MNRITISLIGMCFAFACAASLNAQEQPVPEQPPSEQASPPQEASVEPVTQQTAPQERGHRKLAPGVLQEIPPAPEYSDSVSRHDLVELLAVEPKLDWAKGVPFRRDVWGLEFRFKPVRMYPVDLPQPSGKMARKLVWYMVYNVTNNGNTLHPVKQPNGSYDIGTVAKPVKFVPLFVLEATEFQKAYPDRVIPLAFEQIAKREDPTRKFHSTVDICREIAVGETVWGIVTWEDIDPQIDRFSVYVQGLTNAYRWVDEPGKFQPGNEIGVGRRLSRKTLKLNFWRPGDEFNEHEGEIRFGWPGEVDYEWVFR